MSVAHVEVLVEEPSAEAALRILLPRMLGEATFQVYAHNRSGPRRGHPHGSSSQPLAQLCGAAKRSY